MLVCLVGCLNHREFESYGREIARMCMWLCVLGGLSNDHWFQLCEGENDLVYVCSVLVRLLQSLLDTSGVRGRE